MADKTELSEQIVYANILDKGMKIGMVLLFITFIIYLTGILSPYIPVQDLPQYWELSVHEYLEATGIHAGWSWLNRLNKGDFINFIGIVFLSGVTIACYLRILPILFRKKDTAFAVIAILEVLVLVLAASGLLKAGGH